MANLYINRFVCSVLLVLFSCCGFAQQAKPVAAKTSSKTNAAQCTKGGMACCKGTPTRATVLAANAAIKPVKK